MWKGLQDFTFQDSRNKNRGREKDEVNVRKEEGRKVGRKRGREGGREGGRWREGVYKERKKEGERRRRTLFEGMVDIEQGKVVPVYVSKAHFGLVSLLPGFRGSDKHLRH